MKKTDPQESMTYRFEGEFWKDRRSWGLWFRWFLAGKILTTGTGVLLGAALVGVEAAGWFALGSWILSVIARSQLNAITISGRRAACAVCGHDCGVCLARSLAAGAKRVDGGAS